VAALCENASADEQQEWHGLLAAHREQVGEWADNYPPTFGDKHQLVSAELARTEGRDLDAMRLYEEAIRGRARTASSKTKHWPVRGRAVLRHARLCDDRPNLSVQSGTATTAGARARQGEATRRMLPALAPGRDFHFSRRHHQPQRLDVTVRQRTSRYLLFPDRRFIM
jgi:hypothetical protein